MVGFSLSKSSDNLGNSKPEILVDIVTSVFNELDDDIDIPV